MDALCVSLRHNPCAMRQSIMPHKIGSVCGLANQSLVALGHGVFPVNREIPYPNWSCL